MNQQQLALQAQIDKLTQQNILMKRLASKKGFCQYYFESLPKFSSNTEAFEFVNNLYFELFGEFRYSDYLSFKQAIRWFYKN
jgi:hypothetical protein